jgi:hypothetical protein
MRMPFGQYKGWDIDLIRAEYLRWVIDNCPLRDKELKETIEAQIEYYDDAGPRSDEDHPGGVYILDRIYERSHVQ